MAMTPNIKPEWEEVCSECKGEGWVSGSEAGHGCDGTEADCARNCPIQIQVQIGCELCGGTGKVTNVNKMKEEIGMFRGKKIEDMTREELLTFAGWAAGRIQELEKIADKHYELDLKREILS